VIERIVYNNELIALIIRNNYENSGITFLTPAEFSQQLAYIKHPTGHEIAPHIHRAVTRNVSLTQEVLLVKSGRVQVDLYTSNKQYLRSVVINAGDVILLASGGHGLSMLEETEMIEVKQGPYAGNGDKERFEPNK
jgi:mannose-6-phosphate isomerase-like protein (cupin superfamily)